MTALHLCIDMQVWELQKFMPGHARSLRSAVAGATQRLEANGVQTLYIAFTDALDAAQDPVGNILSSFQSVQRALLSRGDGAQIDLQPPPNALAATKTDFSAAKAKPIADYVAARGTKRIFLSGAWEATNKDFTTCCLTETAIDFRRAGYDVCIIAEATNAALKPSITLADRQRLHRPHGVKVESLAAIMKSL